MIAGCMLLMLFPPEPVSSLDEHSVVAAAAAAGCWWYFGVVADAASAEAILGQCSRIRIFRVFSDFRKNMTFYVFLK